MTTEQTTAITDETTEEEIEDLVGSIKNGYIYMEYKDHTWGSCRHWQTIHSITTVKDEDEAKRIIENKENIFTPCWDFEEVYRDWSDSARNRHRHVICRKKLEQHTTYLLRIYEKNHPSCNRGRWYKKFTYYIIKNAENMELIHEVTLPGV